MARYNTNAGLAVPLTKMNFIVTAAGSSTDTAAFSEVSGVEASVDVIEFRQGNSNSLAPMKLPGLVKHGNVTLKYGCTLSNGFLKWAAACVSETRSQDIYREVCIELIDVTAAAPNAVATTTSGACIWKLKNAWVTKYSAPDLNATANEVAIESVEIAYEELEIPGNSGAAAK